MVSDDVLNMTAEQLIEHYRSEQLSPVEVIQSILDQVDEVDELTNAFVVTLKEQVLCAARGSENRWRKKVPVGRLDGVPVAVKDLTAMKGLPLMRGSRTSDETQICGFDAPCVERMRAAGAIFIGKTTTSEFGWKGVTDSPLTGITRNPWDLSKTPGGSSGGAAVAVAAKMVPLAQGTDGAGSLRIPAAFSGIFSLYPTAGRIPYYPLSFADTASQCGPMTRSVGDAALMFSVMAGPNRKDPINLPANRTDWHIGAGRGVSGMRIAFSPTLGFADVDREIADMVARATGVLVDAGAVVEVVEKVIEDPLPQFTTIWTVLMEHCRVSVDKDRRCQLDQGILAMAEEVRNISVLEFANANYDRAHWATCLNEFFYDYDVLITPQTPIFAFDAGCDSPHGRNNQNWLEWSPFTYPFNFTNHPACTVPCGIGSGGLPAAFQVVAPRFREDLLFRVAAAYEARRPFVLPCFQSLVEGAATEKEHDYDK